MKIKDEVLKKLLPKAREVWWVDSNQLILDGEDKENKPYRPVLIVASNDCLKENLHIINIVPLSTSGKPDKFRFLLGKRAYKHTENDFSPDDNSFALIQLYQPLKYEYFNNRCGVIDETSYSAIKENLCNQLIGYMEYDFEP